jgi:hypothetical protein
MIEMENCDAKCEVERRCCELRQCKILASFLVCDVAAHSLPDCHMVTYSVLQGPHSNVAKAKTLCGEGDSYLGPNETAIDVPSFFDLAYSCGDD